MTNDERLNNLEDQVRELRSTIIENANEMARAVKIINGLFAELDKKVKAAAVDKGIFSGLF